MLRWAVSFFIVALGAFWLGFDKLADTAFEMAVCLGVCALVLGAVALAVYIYASGKVAKLEEEIKKRKDQ